jgi:hypothetical protein
MTEQNKPTCPVCNGNDTGDTPCAYTTEKPDGCLRAARLYKQPPAEAGEGVGEQSAMPQTKQIAGQQISQTIEPIDAVAWLVVAKDSEGEVLIRAPFLNENDARGLMQASVNQGGYRASDVSIQQLYTSQTTATQAAVAAAMRSGAEIVKNARVHTTHGHNRHEQYNNGLSAAEDLILSSIPAEATAALRELLLEVGEEIRYGQPHDDVVTIVDRILSEKGLK